MLQRREFVSGFNYYVPGLQGAGHGAQGHGVFEFSLGTPAAADDDGIHADLDADGALTTITAMVPATGGEGSETSARFGRIVVLSPSGDPGATGYTADIYGRDYLGQPMVERLTVANGQTTDTIGVKAFKYIDKIVPITAATNAITVDVGWGSWFGIPYKMWEIESGLEDNDPVGQASGLSVLGSGNVTISGANAGTIVAPFDGWLIGAYAVITTAVATAAAVMDFTLAGAGNAAGDMIIPVAAAGFVARAAGLGRETAIAVNQGQSLVWTSDGGPSAGVAEVFAEFSRGLVLFKSPVLTDPQTKTTADPRGLITPYATPDGAKEFIYRGHLNSAVNASNNGGLHGIRHHYS